MLKTGDKVTLDLEFNTERYLVLYFYPHDDTPGCTTEACSFRDSIAEFKSLGAKVIGVSMDSAESHQNFTTKYHLTFPLVADIDGLLVNTFGVWKDKAAKTIIRSTFVLDSKGIVLKVWESVDPIVHSQEVYEFLQSLQNQ